MQRFLVLAVVAVTVAYQPPVATNTPIVDRFRPPTTPYGPGNRGIDYATGEGQPVTAAASGQVVFAGQVGGRLHVVVRHADGIRTSYAFLAAITAHTGDHVNAGDVIGTAGTGLHFGARRPDGTYLDPLALLGRRRRAWLVADDSHYTGRPPGNPAGPRTTRGAPTVTPGRKARGAAPW